MTMTPYDDAAQRAAELADQEDRRRRMTAGTATVPCHSCAQLQPHTVLVTGWASSKPHVVGGRVCVGVTRYRVGR